MSARRLMLVLLALAAVAPAGALGSNPKPRTVAPTRSERAAILKAFGNPSKAHAACLIVRLAASNHSYATVRFRARTSCRRWAFNGTNVLKRGKRDHWKVVFEGSAYRCPLRGIPTQVQRDLGVCPA